MLREDGVRTRVPASLKRDLCDRQFLNVAEVEVGPIAYAVMWLHTTAGEKYPLDRKKASP